jgi:hypothetical protein
MHADQTKSENLPLIFTDTTHPKITVSALRLSAFSASLRCVFDFGFPLRP